jgi:predicted dehydrogenase
MAARDPRRAAQAAAKWRVPTVHADYAAVINDPTLDAVYIPLPDSLHAQWTLAAIRAGKYVLCEKPFTSNAVHCVRHLGSGEPTVVDARRSCDPLGMPHLAMPHLAMP